MKKLILTAILVSVSFVIGCQNSIQGFGHDMKDNGQAIENSVDQK